MNILFLTLTEIDSINNKGIYEDLMREFVRDKHLVYIISPLGDKGGDGTHIIEQENCRILKVQTGSIQKHKNVIEKGISTVLLEKQFINVIKHYLSKVKFDLILYSTPPITLAGAVEYVKKRDGAKTYLLLKDIFPQNAVDIGMMSKSGVKGVLYKYFRNKEKKLYALSDYIGCMSQANIDYVLKHNPEIEKSRVEICPNSVEVVDMSVTDEERTAMRQKYGIPLDKAVFVYGGNLGKPQGIPFLIKCLRRQNNNEKVFFLIVGSGTEYRVIEEYIKRNKPKNVKLMSKLPKEDYDAMVGSCDVGMIFLDHRFTIPNFPSRLLSYMQAKMPVLAVTDPNTDIGKVIVDGGFGWWCESNDAEEFGRIVDKAAESTSKNLIADELSAMGQRSFQYLREHYSSISSYEIIMSKERIKGIQK